MIINCRSVVRIECQRQPNAGAIGMAKCMRHHAYYRSGSAIDYDRASHRVCSRIQGLTPEIIAHNHDCRGVVATLLGSKISAFRRQQSKNSKKIGGYPGGRNRLSRRTVVQSDNYDAARARPNIFKNLTTKFLYPGGRAISKVQGSRTGPIFIQGFEDSDKLFRMRK